MRMSSMMLSGTFLMALVACAPKQAPNTVAVTTTSTRNAPAWIDNEEIPDGLGAVGIAQPNPMGDKSFQRSTAVADARTKLAGKLKIRVQNMFSQLNQQVTTANAATGDKPIKSDVMNRVVENVTRQVVDQELVGTNTRGTWTDPSDGSLYVFVVQTKDSVDRAMAGAAQAAIRKEIAQGEKSLDHALDKLDAAIAASEAPQSGRTPAPAGAAPRSEQGLNAALDKLDPGKPAPATPAQ